MPTATKPFYMNCRPVDLNVDPEVPVQVYRNLHKDCLSVRQSGIVLCHTNWIVLHNATFKVSVKGRDRVRREKRKNVHAWVEGFPVDPYGDMRILQWGKAYYNPYTTDWWTVVGGDKWLKRADYVDLYCDKSHACVKTLGVDYL